MSATEYERRISMSNDDNGSALKIIDFDRSYVDQHVQLRDEVIESWRFRTNELEMDEHDLIETYDNPLLDSMHLLKYAVEGDRLVGLVSANIHNNIASFISVENLANDAHILYPIVKEDREEVGVKLLQALLAELRSVGVDQAKLTVQGEGMSGWGTYKGKLGFELDKANLREALIRPAEVGGKFDPVEGIEDYSEVLKERIIELILEQRGIPRDYLEEQFSLQENEREVVNIIQKENGEIVAWLKLVEADGDYGFKFPFVLIDDSYTERALGLIGEVTRRAGDQGADLIRVMPAFSPEVFDKLEELGAEMNVLMGTYVIDLK